MLVISKPDVMATHGYHHNPGLETSGSASYQLRTISGTSAECLNDCHAAMFSWTLSDASSCLWPPTKHPREIEADP